ncbi:hypothetical protein BKA69DRAFT_1077686 [Paraphysoderma sedebokerense]|nr:hypothetical protein BKA69DRAFT_1085747 [Paraphysoderma sedebokerense]KAI9140786.1 hypothetical protein BKA69DRAFT_1077686 [Paraphysoderma sedebokerense]
MNQHGPVRKKLKVSNAAASSPSYPFNSENTIHNHHTIPSPIDSTTSNPIAFPSRQPQIPQNPIQLTPTDYFKLQSTLTELSDFLSAKHSESLPNEVNTQISIPESHSLLQSHSDTAHLRKVNEKLRKQNEQYKKQIEELKKSNEEIKFQKEVLDARVLVLERIQASRLLGLDGGSGNTNTTSGTASGHAGPTEASISSIWGSLQCLAPGAINGSDTVIQSVIQTIMKSQLNNKPSLPASASTDSLISISTLPKHSESRSSQKSSVENQQESQASEEYPASEPPTSSSSASLPLPQSVQLWQAVTKASQLQSAIKNPHPTTIPIPPLPNSAISFPTPPVPVPLALHSKSTSSSSSSSSSSHQNGLSQSQSISNVNSTPDLSSSTNPSSYSRSRTAHLPRQSNESDSEGSTHNSQQLSQDPEYDYEKLSGFVSQVRSLLAMQPYRTV